MKNKLTIIILFMSVYGFAQQLNPINFFKYRKCITCDKYLDEDPNQLYIYGDPTIFPTEKIASDYGPRVLDDDPYDWHGGVDYNSDGGDNDKGDILISMASGDVILKAKGCYKWIAVDDNNGLDFGYGHIFKSSGGEIQSAGMYLMLMKSPNAGEFCIVQKLTTVANGINKTTIKAIGEIPGKVEFEGTEYTVNTNINLGDNLAPIGTSIGNCKGSQPDPCSSCRSQHISAHAHLYSFPNNNFSIADNNTKNPLEFVNHDIPSFDVDFNSSNFQLEYPGSTKSSIKIAPALPNESGGGGYKTVNKMDDSSTVAENATQDIVIEETKNDDTTEA